MGYLSESNGSTRYNGVIVRYKKGYNDVKKGTLDHVGSCKWVGKKPRTTNVKAEEVENRSDTPNSSNTVEEIKQWLDDKDVDYKSSATKKELLEAVANA